MDRMQPWEATILLENLKFGNKQDWEMTRLLMYVTAQVNTTKKLKLSDVLTLPWDEINHNYNISDDDIKRLNQRAKSICDKFNTSKSKNTTD